MLGLVAFNELDITYVVTVMVVLTTSSPIISPGVTITGT